MSICISDAIKIKRITLALIHLNSFQLAVSVVIRALSGNNQEVSQFLNLLDLSNVFFSVVYVAIYRSVRNSCKF